MDQSHYRTVNEGDASCESRDMFCLPPRGLEEARAKIAEKLRAGTLGSDPARLLPHAHYAGRSNQT